MQMLRPRSSFKKTLTLAIMFFILEILLLFAGATTARAESYCTCTLDPYYGPYVTEDKCSYGFSAVCDPFSCNNASCPCQCKLSSFSKVKEKVFPAGSLLAGDPAVGDLINNLFPYIFGFAGITLFVFLIIGGFQIMTAGDSPDKMEAGQKKITAAIIGFLIIFAAYWIIQLAEKLLGIEILGTVATPPTP